MVSDWAKKRKAELEARAPVKRKKTKPFVFRLELDSAATAFTALDCAKATVWLWLLYQTKMTGNKTIAVPNGALSKYGVSRKQKSIAIRRLEKAGLITVDRRSRKTPIVTVRD